MSTGLDDFPLLRSVNLPGELRALPENRLPAMCTELREYLIERGLQRFMTLQMSDVPRPFVAG